MDQYLDFLEACAEERGIGSRYTASHFKTFEELDAVVPEGMVLLVDYFGEELVTRNVFFQMAHSLALRALETGQEQKLETLADLPKNWRTRIEAVLPKLEKLVKTENTSSAN